MSQSLVLSGSDPFVDLGSLVEDGLYRRSQLRASPKCDKEKDWSKTWSAGPSNLNMILLIGTKNGSFIDLCLMQMLGIGFIST